MKTSTPLLEVQGLRIAARYNHGFRQLTRDVSFRLDHGQRVAIVGESGSGKTITSFAICGILDIHPGLFSGSVKIRGVDIYEGLSDIVEISGTPQEVVIRKQQSAFRHLIEKQVRPAVLREIGLIFQEARESLDPLRQVEQQLTETMRARSPELSQEDAKLRCIRLLEDLRLSSDFVNRYPHETAGGEAQRVGIALALATEPSILIADEPTSSLDPIVQKAVADCLLELHENRNLAVLLITHNLNLAAYVCTTFVVMYRGVTLEIIGANPLRSKLAQLHPYTADLVAASLWPSNHSVAGTSVSDNGHSQMRSHAAQTVAPEYKGRPRGCPYYDRCRKKSELGEQAQLCEDELPELDKVSENHQMRCWAFNT